MTTKIAYRNNSKTLLHLSDINYGIRSQNVYQSQSKRTACGTPNSANPDQAVLKEQSDLGVHCFFMFFCCKIYSL